MSYYLRLQNDFDYFINFFYILNIEAEQEFYSTCNKTNM